MDAHKIVEEQYSVGAKLQIANPFVKISPGVIVIRVEDSREVRLLSAAEGTVDDIVSGAEKAKAEFEKEKLDSVRKINLETLKSPEWNLQVNLTCDRAPANLKDGRFAAALGDASVVLSLRPKKRESLGLPRFCS